VAWRLIIDPGVPKGPCANGWVSILHHVSMHAEVVFREWDIVGGFPVLGEALARGPACLVMTAVVSARYIGTLLTRVATILIIDREAGLVLTRWGAHCGSAHGPISRVTLWCRQLSYTRIKRRSFSAELLASGLRVRTPLTALITLDRTLYSFDLLVSLQGKDLICKLGQIGAFFQLV
jgi:hypothetical protein